MKLHIVHIYPNEMNTYGDRGNLLTLTKRAMSYGYEPVVHYYESGGSFPAKADIVLGGGGQDSAQSDIQADIMRIGDKLHELSSKGVPMLMVCGTYQLLGNRFVTSEGEEIQGIGIFDVHTIGGTTRLIGNTSVETEDFGLLYGFENHSGKTYLSAEQQAFGKVARGNGNNGEDKSEGARTKNAIGTYMHGPILPINPSLTDGLIKLAVSRTGNELPDTHIDDSLAERCRLNASRREY